MPRKFVRINIGGKIRSQVAGGLNKLRYPLVSATGNLVGRRGIAAGSYAYRQRRREMGQEPYTAEERARWQTLSAGTVELFLNGGIFVVNSSNVSTVRFLADEQKMIVVFKGGQGYEYSNVSVAEAQSFAFAASKGGWIWGHLRIRGTKTGHQKPYRKLFFTERDEPTTGIAGPRSKYHDFVHRGELLIVQKGGVEFAHYLASERTLLVAHSNGTSFEYANINLQEATSFALARDKGKWILEIAHRKPFRRLDLPD